MFNIFTKKNSKENTNKNEVRGYIVPKYVVKEFVAKKFEPKVFEPKVFEPKVFEPEKRHCMIKYKDRKTGEVFTIDLYDDESFERMMTNSHGVIILSKV